MIGRRSVPPVASAGVWSAWLLCAMGIILGVSRAVTIGFGVLLSVPILCLSALLLEGLRSRRPDLVGAVAVLLLSLACSLAAKLLGLA